MDIRETVKHEGRDSTGGQRDLHEKQVAVLVFLGRLGGQRSPRPTADQIAIAIGENPTRARYHLDRLMERELVDHALSMSAPTTYYLTAAGRAYVVERDLV